MTIFSTTTFDADAEGFFGEYGGRYVPELLTGALDELARAYEEAKADPDFEHAFMDVCTNYSGRPTPLYFAENLTNICGGARIFLKLENLNHTGAHKINHCLGHALVAKRMGKTRLIAETGAGQHGLAVATVAAKFGFDCTVYMGEIDIERQRPNVFWMEQLGATVVPVSFGDRRLKDAVMAALQDWIASFPDSYYVLGSALGPHPFPSMVRDFQSIVGVEVKAQLHARSGRAPDYLIACVGGGSNAIGLFHPFLDDADVRLIGVEAGGSSTGELGCHAARFSHGGRPGIVEGYRSYFLQDDDGQVARTHSIAAGLDYAGIGPEHSLLFEKGRVEYCSASDAEALEAFRVLARTEGIFPALESAHAVAEAMKSAPKCGHDEIMVVNISGRGDKDLFTVADAFGDASWKTFLRRQAHI